LKVSRRRARGDLWGGEGVWGSEINLLRCFFCFVSSFFGGCLLQNRGFVFGGLYFL
jgi:hypothetical protein